MTKLSNSNLYEQDLFYDFFNAEVKIRVEVAKIYSNGTQHGAISGAVKGKNCAVFHTSAKFGVLIPATI